MIGGKINNIVQSHLMHLGFNFSFGVSELITQVLVSNVCFAIVNIHIELVTCQTRGVHIPCFDAMHICYPVLGKVETAHGHQIALAKPKDLDTRFAGQCLL